MSSSVIFDQSRLRAYDGLVRLCEYSGEAESWCSELWNEMLLDQELYEAFIYYLEHHSFSEDLKCEGYSLIDCYVWEMEQDNLRRDTGKNTESCNKEDMVLHAFRTMAKMRKSPEEYLKKMNRWGIDQSNG